MRIPDYLLEGYRRFRRGRFADEATRFRNLAAGEQPSTMVIGCADSRVDPAIIFGSGPGELYVVRNVAALVPPFEMGGGYHGTSTALEFAVTSLKVKHIVVMGHGQCCGIAAALAAVDERPAGQFIGPWMSLLDDVRDRLIEITATSPASVRQKALERMAVQQSLANLLTFPFIEAAVDIGTLNLEGAWFSIGDGELHWLDWDRGVFELVEAS